MRKLTVKNFSVIKDAETTPLEFGKITVLIGPQSSGKSLLCKLAYFISAQLPILTVDAVASGQSWNMFESFVIQKFGEWFPLEGWGLDPISIKFQAYDYEVEFCGSRRDGSDQQLRVEFSHKFVDVYSNLKKEREQFDALESLHSERFKERAWGEIMRLINPSILERTTFIPAGRSLFVNTATGYAALSNTDIDPLIKLFAQEISWKTTQWKSGLVTSGRDVTQKISRKFGHIMRGQVVVQANTPVFQSDDNRVLPLSFLSSGTQELLPLFNVLERKMYWQEHEVVYTDLVPGFTKSPISPSGTSPLIFVEEPEAHIFPNTQYEVVRLFAWLTNDPILNFQWVIATHSPYILSSFNNLIEAGQAARSNPALHDEIAKIVPEQYWIKEGDFKAYAIEDGKLRSILNESGFIEGNYLDQVSEVIGNEFDKLLRLEYEHTKAS
jgi:hypothetical protein